MITGKTTIFNVSYMGIGIYNSIQDIVRINKMLGRLTRSQVGAIYELFVDAVKKPASVLPLGNPDISLTMLEAIQRGFIEQPIASFKSRGCLPLRNVFAQATLEKLFNKIEEQKRLWISKEENRSGIMIEEDNKVFTPSFEQYKLQTELELKVYNYVMPKYYKPQMLEVSKKSYKENETITTPVFEGHLPEWIEIFGSQKNVEHFDEEEQPCWTTTEYEIDRVHNLSPEYDLQQKATKQITYPKEYADDIKGSILSEGFDEIGQAVDKVAHQDRFDKIVNVDAFVEPAKPTQLINVLLYLIPELINQPRIFNLLKGYKNKKGTVKSILKWKLLNKSIFKVPKDKSLGLPIIKIKGKKYVKLGSEYISIQSNGARDFSDLKQLWIMYKIYLMLQPDLRKLSKEDKNVLPMMTVTAKESKEFKAKLESISKMPIYPNWDNKPSKKKLGAIIERYNEDGILPVEYKGIGTIRNSELTKHINISKKYGTRLKMLTSILSKCNNGTTFMVVNNKNRSKYNGPFPFIHQYQQYKMPYFYPKIDKTPTGYGLTERYYKPVKRSTYVLTARTDLNPIPIGYSTYLGVAMYHKPVTFVDVPEINYKYSWGYKKATHIDGGQYKPVTKHNMKKTFIPDKFYDWNTNNTGFIDNSSKTWYRCEQRLGRLIPELHPDLYFPKRIYYRLWDVYWFS